MIRRPLLARAANAARSVIAACVAVAAIAWSGAPTSAQSPAPVGVPVFTYHMVDRRIPTDRIGNALTVTPEQFEAQLRTLVRLRLHTTTAQGLVAALRHGRLPARTVVLTFDDGYANARTFALPLLLRYHATATFYVISSTIGTPRHLSWRDIRVMRAAGMEIGAHGREHVDLTELDARGQRAQVDGCVRTLRRWANITPATYAYPSGRFDATTQRVMRQSGMSAAFTEEYGYVHSLANPYRLPRVRILRADAESLFARIVAPLVRRSIDPASTR